MCHSIARYEAAPAVPPAAGDAVERVEPPPSARNPGRVSQVAVAALVDDPPFAVQHDVHLHVGPVHEGRHLVHLRGTAVLPGRRIAVLRVPLGPIERLVRVQRVQLLDPGVPEVHGAGTA
eukprot:1327508-Rhodomonas_salina.3